MDDVDADIFPGESVNQNANFAGWMPSQNFPWPEVSRIQRRRVRSSSPGFVKGALLANPSVVLLILHGNQR